MSNGFILLPVLLSIFGPTSDVGHVVHEDDDEETKQKKNLVEIKMSEDSNLIDT